LERRNTVTQSTKALTVTLSPQAQPLLDPLAGETPDPKIAHGLLAPTTPSFSGYHDVMVRQRLIESQQAPEPIIVTRRFTDARHLYQP
jgi:hypothetical protein